MPLELCLAYRSSKIQFVQLTWFRVGKKNVFRPENHVIDSLDLFQESGLASCGSKMESQMFPLIFTLGIQKKKKQQKTMSDCWCTQLQEKKKCIFVNLHSSAQTLAFCNLGRGCHSCRLRACISFSRTWFLQRCFWSCPPAPRDEHLDEDLSTEAFPTCFQEDHYLDFLSFFFFLCLLSKLSENGNLSLLGPQRFGLSWWLRW